LTDQVASRSWQRLPSRTTGQAHRSSEMLRSGYQ